ncbi:MAG: hypothetical protein JO097_12275, partial [Acidobacteriaceae bacterium]|nr:hypothetical protein [Acidobacteriaceae bacterium]
MDEHLGDDLSRADYRAYRECLRNIQARAQEVGLGVLQNVTTAAIKDAFPDMTFQQARDRLAELQRCLHSELASKVFLFVPTERLKYLTVFHTDEEAHRYGEEIAKFVPIIEKFPSGAYDIREAGNCFAYGLYTACV